MKVEVAFREHPFVVLRAGISEVHVEHCICMQTASQHTTEIEMEKVYHMAIKKPLINDARKKFALANLFSSLDMPSSCAILSSIRVFLLFRFFRLDRCCCVRPVSSSSSNPSSECMSSISQSELDLARLSVSFALLPSVSSPASGISGGSFGLGVFLLLLLAWPSRGPYCESEALRRRVCPSDSMFGKLRVVLSYNCSLMANKRKENTKARVKRLVDHLGSWVQQMRLLLNKANGGQENVGNNGVCINQLACKKRRDG